MTRQWNRQVRLLLGDKDGKGLELSDLRLVFSTRHADLTQPNTCDVRIYNVAPATARRAEQEFTKIVLQAGYLENFATIFQGTIVQTRRGRESPTDTFLDITAMDSEVAYSFAVVNKTLAAGWKPEDKLREQARAMQQYGVTEGFLDTPSTNAMPRGTALFGMARDYLRDYAEGADRMVSIQQGVLQCLAPNGTLPEPAIVLTSETGMIGLPELTAEGVCVRTLLNPAFRVGSKVILDNASIQQPRLASSYQGIGQTLLMPSTDADGLYRVLTVDHMGDTRGTVFHSRIVCLGLLAPVPITLAARGIAG